MEKTYLLTEVECNIPLYIINIQTNPKVQMRLNALGILKNEELVKESGLSFKGPVLIKIKNTRLILGHNIAKQIIVSKAIKNV